MPLQTQIVRNGEPIRLRWGYWHVVCMEEAAEAEGHDINKEGEVTLKENHTFTDPDDGEVLNLYPGDVLRMWYRYSR